jgi:hypothetical protein
VPNLVKNPQTMFWLKSIKLLFYFLEIVTLTFDPQTSISWDLFLYSYEADFIQGLRKKNQKKLARSFNFTFRYIDDIRSLNNSRFGDFVDRPTPLICPSAYSEK